MDATKIGRFIGAERRAKGWTQRQLADKLQLTDKAISRWETGKVHAGTWPPIAPPPFLHRIGRISAVCCGVLDVAIFAAGSDRWGGHPWL